MYCISTEATKCPITKISFTNYLDKIAITTTRNPTDGLPIIDLKMSQGGNPCFSKDSFNSLYEEKINDKTMKYSAIMGR